MDLARQKQTKNKLKLKLFIFSHQAKISIWTFDIQNKQPIPFKQIIRYRVRIVSACVHSYVLWLVSFWVHPYPLNTFKTQCSSLRELVYNYTSTDDRHVIEKKNYIQKYKLQIVLFVCFWRVIGTDSLSSSCHSYFECNLNEMG